MKASRQKEEDCRGGGQINTLSLLALQVTVFKAAESTKREQVSSSRRRRVGGVLEDHGRHKHHLHDERTKTRDPQGA